jgi:ATP-dependent Clp protease ATP-binding subunit ClpA
VRGYDKKMGARPMARVIQEHIKRPLAEELLFGKLAQGGHVRVEVAANGESLELTVEPLQRELEDLRGKGPAQRELAGGHKGEE